MQLGFTHQASFVRCYTHSSRHGQPKPVPNYKGTPAYEARQQASKTADVDTEDFDAATALVAFQHSQASDAEKAPATHIPTPNIIRVPPLKPKHVVLDPTDKAFAQSMGMSQEEIVAQKQWELENGSDCTNAS